MRTPTSSSFRRAISASRAGAAAAPASRSPSAARPRTTWSSSVRARVERRHGVCRQRRSRGERTNRIGASRRRIGRRRHAEPGEDQRVDAEVVACRRAVLAHAHEAQRVAPLGEVGPADQVVFGDVGLGEVGVDATGVAGVGARLVLEHRAAGRGLPVEFHDVGAVVGAVRELRDQLVAAVGGDVEGDRDGRARTVALEEQDVLRPEHVLLHRRLAGFDLHLAGALPRPRSAARCRSAGGRRRTAGRADRPRCRADTRTRRC